MGELGFVRNYEYWGERRIRNIASANGVALERKLNWKAKLAAIPLLGSVEIAQVAQTLDRAEVARRFEEAIGGVAVRDFVNPPPAGFAKGVGPVEFALFESGSHKNEGVVLHTSTRSTTGAQVAVCLFGSLANMADNVGASDTPLDGWTSSARPAITRFILSQGTINNSQWDDPEALAVEALKIATEHGMNREWDKHRDQPWLRGFALGHAQDAEWFAQIYSDVVLDKDRWTFGPTDAGYGVDRILVGAPLWVRTPGPYAVTRYRDQRDNRTRWPRRAFGTRQS